MHIMAALLAQTVPDGRVFGLDSQTLSDIGLQLLNGIILAVALSWLLYKPVKEFLQKRTERIQNEKADAEATMAKGNKLIAEYDQKIQDIDKERIEILEAARIEASDESNIILADAREQAQKVKQRSLESISKEKERLQEETRLYIIELASMLAEESITTNIDSDAQAKIFEQTLAELEDTQWQS